MTRQQFVGEVENWDNHRVFLWDALQLTKGLVIELGMGKGSTNQLHEYCYQEGRELRSYDYDQEWAEAYYHLRTELHTIEHCPDWNKISIECDLLFVDHSPGERRWVDIERAANKAKIIVIHDSEPEATGYMLDKVWPLFKYRKDYTKFPAWTTMVSNFIQL